MSDNTVANSGSCPTAKGAMQELGFQKHTQGGGTREQVIPMPTMNVSCKVSNVSTSGICTNRTPGHTMILKEAVHERLSNKPSCGN